MSAKMGRPITEPCGTEPAYKRNARAKRKGEPNCGPCDECKAAWSAAQREYYRRRKGIS